MGRETVFAGQFKKIFYPNASVATPSVERIDCLRRVKMEKIASDAVLNIPIGYKHRNN